MIALLATNGHLPLWLFVIGITLDFGIPFVAELAGATPWHPHHIAERYGLFFIIVLGETILLVTLALRVAYDADHPPTELWLVVVGGVLITFCSWWIYFSRDETEILIGNDIGFKWGFGHYVIFASAAAIGAGLAARIAFYDDHAKVGDLVSSAFVTGPVAALLAAMWFVSLRLHDSSVHTASLFAAAVLAISAVTFVPYSELWVGIIVVTLLVSLVRAGADHETAVGVES